MSGWIVVMTRPCQERIAEENIRRQHYDFYFPRILVQKGKNLIPQLLFPRYGFVMMVSHWWSLRGTRGVSKVLLGDDGSPAVLPKGVIEGIQRHERNGYVRLDEVPLFVKGQALRAPASAFSEHTMICDGMSGRNRVKVLINMMSRLVACELGVGELVAA